MSRHCMRGGSILARLNDCSKEESGQVYLVEMGKGRTRPIALSYDRGAKEFYQPKNGNCVRYTNRGRGNKENRLTSKKTK